MNKMIEQYSIVREIGSGQFGKVFSGVNTIKNEKVAIKQMSLSKFKQIP